MAKSLIIAEKPSLAMNIVKAIGKMNKQDGYYENDNYIVTFAFGHLLQLKTIEQYLEKDSKAKWELYELPFFPEKFDFILSDDTGIKKQYSIITKLIKREDVIEIVNCGDSDREGEVIINNIIYTIFKEQNCNKKILRLWLPEQTEGTIKKELNQLKPITQTQNLMEEGLTRTYRLVIWNKYN